MFTMDLKSKGITWVGSIYQKFEAMCLEVEDIMCQEPSKYVESQVQTVSVSVKKFYAEVMEDLLPPSSVDPVEEEGSDLSLAQNTDAGTHKESKVAIEEDPIEEKLPAHIELELIANVVKDSSQASLSSGVRDIKHPLPPSFVDPVKEAGSDLSLEQNDNVGMYKKLKAGIEEDPIKDKPPTPEVPEVIAPAGNDSSQASLFSSVCNNNHLLTSSSADFIKGTGSNLSLEQNDNVGMNNKTSVCIEEYPMEEKLPPPEESELIAPAGKGSSRASFFSGLHSENHEKACEKLAKMSPPTSPSTSVEVTRCNSPSKAGTSCSDDLVETRHVADISTALPSSLLVLPVVSCENKVVEIGLTPSSSIFSMESNGIDTSTTHGTVSLMGSSWNGQEQYSEHAELDAFISPLEIGKYAITGRSDDDNEERAEGNDAVEPGMETIEEFGNAKLEESCIVVDSKELCFVSHRAGRHRSYKKKIQDAFASRMRLAKKQEYEQLAIWYGDIDAETSQKRTDNSTMCTGELDLKKLPTDDFCESEWELL